MKNFYKQGVTVVELIIVIAVLSVIFSIIIPQFSDIRENQVLKNGVQDLLSSINKARAGTLASLDSSSYGVHFQSDKVIVFKGTVFSVDALDNEVINILSPASISNVTLDGVNSASGDIYFNRLSGTPNKIGTITVSTPSFSKIITIATTGTVSVN